MESEDKEFLQSLFSKRTENNKVMQMTIMSKKVIKIYPNGNFWIDKAKSSDWIQEMVEVNKQNNSRKRETKQELKETEFLVNETNIELF